MLLGISSISAYITRLLCCVQPEVKIPHRTPAVTPLKGQQAPRTLCQATGCCPSSSSESGCKPSRPPWWQCLGSGTTSSRPRSFCWTAKPVSLGVSFRPKRRGRFPRRIHSHLIRSLRALSHNGPSFEQSQGCSSEVEKSLGGWDPVSSAQVTADTGVQLSGTCC